MKSRTETEDKLWEALHANPHSAAAVLSTAAGIGKSTAAKILARWVVDGSVTRTPGIAEGGRRAADLWSITDPDVPEADVPKVHTSEADTAHSADIDEPQGVAATASPGTPTGDTDESAVEVATVEEPLAEVKPDTVEPSDDDNEASDGGQPKKRRLPPGGLRGLVEDFLREHSGEEFSPNKIGKELDRSSGAVNNALEKLVVDGYAVMTNDKPKRFSLAPIEKEPESDATTD
ncbi:MarR family transcriptional regulator [Lentzea sp. NPDC051213]|uniref:MarR family transcriptional regulator n=1 Tax=Lentzea sp. NPDC051213 TaxID=3364126 RepID=UPI00379AD699